MDHVRLHPRDEDPDRLLNRDEQSTEPWGGTIIVGVRSPDLERVEQLRTGS